MLKHTHINPEDKLYVKVRLDHDIDGTTTPLMFRAADGPKIIIDKVALADKQAGKYQLGFERKYKCRVNGQVLYLYYEGTTSRWFVEKRKLRGGLVAEDEWEGA